VVKPTELRSALSVRLGSSGWLAVGFAAWVRKFNVEWNWVVRRAIESYIENLEGGGVAVPAEELLKEQNRLGAQPQDLEPLSPEVDDKMYGEIRERRALDG